MSSIEPHVEFRECRGIPVMHLSVKPPEESSWGQERIIAIQVWEGPWRADSSSLPPEMAVAVVGDRRWRTHKQE